METMFTHLEKGAFIKKSMVILLTSFCLLFANQSSAHAVTGYTATCNTGPVYNVDATVINVNSSSNYAWQYKNASNVWVCILNGNNTINGSTYSVSGATSTATTNPAPIIFNNPNSGLQGLIIRCVISDGTNVNPCSMPSGNTYNSSSSSVNFSLNVNGSPCTTTIDCSCVNSTGNLLTNPSFENGSTGWSVSGGTITTGTGYVMCGAANGFLNWSSGTAKIWQDVTVAQGSVVTFKGYSGTHAPGINCSPKLSLIYLNSTGGVISQLDAVVTKNVDVSGGTLLNLYSLTGTAPSGTTKVRIQGSISCNTLKVDAFCLTVTPPAAVPDLTPRINLNPNNIIGQSSMEITVQVNEINNVPTNGSLITLYVDKQNLFSNFSFNSAQTTNAAGQPVQNNLFSIDAVSNPDFYVITTNAAFVNSLRRVTFSVTVKPGQTKGSTPINVLLKDGSGGETNFTNNSNFTVLTFSF